MLVNIPDKSYLKSSDIEIYILNYDKNTKNIYFECDLRYKIDILSEIFGNI